MKKPTQLRDHLLQAIASLQANPDRLLVFVEDGSLASVYSANMSFSYAYSLNLVVTDYTGDPDTIMLPLLQWLTRHQPELLSNPARRGEVKFEVDVLANDLVDVSITLPLTERVVVSDAGEGQMRLSRPDEPNNEPEIQPAFKGGVVFDEDGQVVVTLPAIVP